jgi:hypothetical protein
VITSKDVVESQIQKESNMMLRNCSIFLKLIPDKNDKLIRRSLDQQILQLTHDKLQLTKKLTEVSSDVASNARVNIIVD